jgi:hypothetical protein
VASIEKYKFKSLISMLAATKNSSPSGSSSTITVASTPSQSISVAPKVLVYNLQTTQLLKMLSRIFPTWECSSEWLHKNVRKHGTYTFQQDIGIVLKYTGQPGGANTEHHWEIRVDSLFAERVRTCYEQIISGESALMPLQQGSTESSQYSHSFNGLNFRSLAEVKIATCLEKRGILFFANARCRIRSRSKQTETKEADFLVFYQSSARILEVDGREYHQDRAKDYKRDRMFDREGIVTTRFSAKECLDNPEEVIDEFLDLFRV